MDTIYHTAIEEICCEGLTGLHIRNLWPKLAILVPFTANMKRVVFDYLVSVPGLRFGARGGSVLRDRGKCAVEELEGKDVRIVASEAMINGFLGISAIQASECCLSPVQLNIVRLLALARTNGIAQSDLSKKLGLEARNLAYPLKTLEVLGLIVSLPAVIRKKGVSNCKETSNGAPTPTNIIYLFRYGKHLGTQQRFEIHKEDKILTSEEVGDAHSERDCDLGEETEKEDISIKDFLPAMEAICTKLEKAKGKVLAVSEIKRDLGYTGKAGHRDWKIIFRRLEGAQVVKECHTEINKKKIICLLLLKKFSPSHFEQKTHENGHDKVGVKRGQITNQLVELPVLRQIYDTIDAAGSKGLTNPEVCRALGLCSKDYHKRCFEKKQKIFRFGLHAEKETRDKNSAFRLYTDRNFNSKLNSHKKLVNASTPIDNLKATTETENSAPVIVEASNDMNVDVDSEGKSDQFTQRSPQNSKAEPFDGVERDEPNNAQHGVERDEPNNAQQEKSCHTVPKRSRIRLQRHPCLITSVTNSKREEQILKMLQEEKFLIKPDLHRRLEILEKENKSEMDRKTLHRCLVKLKQEGHCKYFSVSVPSVTNCSRSIIVKVVLQPSVKESDELFSQIHDKYRNFQTEACTNHLHSQQSMIPLDNVQSVPNGVRLAGRAGAMRSNGFVLAKMVRLKLLHVFLWDWVSNVSGCDDDLLAGNHACGMKNPHSSCKLFELDLAFKSMPLELFLQVVGSAKDIDDMVEKCGSDFLLSDLSADEYKSVMDTRAIGRLSLLIDLLRRLKLIRLVSKGLTEDQGSRPHSTLTHALEIKPYIEEPASTAFSVPGFLFPDLRPQIRHDFVLSSKEDVDDYWNTLEYCYSTADSRAALLAFPGSAVNEVFRPRSWIAARVVTAGQWAELLKRVPTDDPSKKLSFSAYRKIASDLNLTLEQVLRFYYDKSQHCVNGIISDAGTEDIQPILPRKRKRHSGRVSSDEQSTEKAHGSMLGSDKQFNDDKLFKMCHTSHTSDDTEGQEDSNEDEEARTFIHKGLSRSGPKRQKRFSWTEEADRQLMVEYARRRAVLGAKSNRFNWTAIPNLPAHPDACKRRLALLRSDVHFRKAVSVLCTTLASRYAKYLETCQDKTTDHVDSEKFQEYAFEGKEWDDFLANDIKDKLDIVLQYKRASTLVKDNPGQERKKNNFNDCGGTKALNQRSSCQKLPIKYAKLLNKGASFSGRMYESVAIANASELFKLIFLSSSSAPEVPTVLAETLRRYSEHDLFSAFNHLRENKIMVGGNGKPFALSRQFLQSTCPLTFPTDTGKNAATFTNWLDERENDLLEEGIDVPLGLQCDEVFALCAKFSSGELSITARLPDEGVGGPEDKRTSKHKYDCSDPDYTEITSHQGKGFPGIKLSLHRSKYSKPFANESSKDESLEPSALYSDDANHLREILDSEGRNHTVSGNESTWEAMTVYAVHVIPSYHTESNKIETSILCSELFQTLYSAIQMSGDQGLSMNDIRKLLKIEDENVVENVVEVLELFGRVLKVNAYDSIHVVDSLYRSKYFLSPVQHHPDTPSKGQKRKLGDENTSVNLGNHVNNSAASEKETNMINDKTHRVTFLNLPKDVSNPLEDSGKDKMTVNNHSEVAPSEMDTGVESRLSGCADDILLACHPLFPWINGDGTINEPVYNRLKQRILGIVVQNPGILEDGIMNQMHCLNPQSCRKLIEIMIMDNHIIPREMHQDMRLSQPPSILGRLVGDYSRKRKLICRVHYFANPMSTSCL